MKYIYGLVDPRTRGVRYVGQTVSPEQRYSQHVSSTENTPKGVWIQELRSVGLKPDFIILDTTESEDQVNYLETWWILLGRRQGWELTNGTNPGVWRASEDFKIIFADELLRMYDEHRTACERLSAETISMAIEHAKRNENVKWANRVQLAVTGLVSLFGAASFVHFSIDAWTPAGSMNAFAYFGFASIWIALLICLYLYHYIMKVEREDPVEPDPISMTFPSWAYYVMISCVTVMAGTMAIVDLIKRFA